MTDPQIRHGPLMAAAAAWRAFWFSPEPVYALGLVRMAFGVLTTGWAVSLLPDLFEWFGPHGVKPQPPEGNLQWGVFGVWNSDRALVVGWIVLLACSVALTIGWHSRLAAVAVFVLILSFEHRDQWVFNSGDLAVRIEALMLALSPCGAALSLDQRRSTGSYWSAQQRSPWALRLMQVQLSLIYLASVQAKLNGNAWPQGTAVSYALRLPDMQLLSLPQWVALNPLLMNAATWATVAAELSVGILVWNRRLRPWVLALGVVMHTMIMIFIAVGFFTLAMFVLYLAFVPSDTVERLPLHTRRLESTPKPESAVEKPTDTKKFVSGGDTR